MGCCCPKTTFQNENESNEERTILISNEQKSRLVESNLSNGNQNFNQQLSSNFNGSSNYMEGYQQTENYEQNTINTTIFQNNALSQENLIIEKILSDVIHVSAFDQRSIIQSSDLMQFSSDHLDGVQELSLKIKDLLEPTLNKQQLTLPEGVSAPFSILAAQPPFQEDIKLINKMAVEAWNCVHNFSLYVPDNVAFDFNPINI